MGRPKGFVPQPCVECGNRGRHKVSCSKSGRTNMKEPERKPLQPTVRPYKRKEETAEEKSALVEGGMPAIHARVSMLKDNVCGCGEKLPITRQHWTDGRGRLMCMTCAYDYQRESDRAGKITEEV